MTADDGCYGAGTGNVPMTYGDKSLANLAASSGGMTQPQINDRLFLLECGLARTSVWTPGSILQGSNTAFLESVHPFVGSYRRNTIPTAQ